MTISDGAIMPLGGLIHNEGIIQLGSLGASTELEILFPSATLDGGGQVVLSDNSQNMIFGGDADTALINLNNTISGAGQIGAGQMTLDNHGTIVADGSHALVIDTGSHAVNNTGTLEATGTGGLFVAGDISNLGLLWANDAQLTVGGNVSGSGAALISGNGIIDFGAAASTNVTFDVIGNGTLTLDHASAFTGSVSGFNAGDKLDFADLLGSPETVLQYVVNAEGTGGTLTLNDATHSASLNLLGQYEAEGFSMEADLLTGAMVSYLPKLADQPLV
jgi:hypothetical protein